MSMANKCLACGFKDCKNCEFNPSLQRVADPEMFKIFIESLSDEQLEKLGLKRVDK